MYPSSIACRIEYTWNGTFMPVSPGLSEFGRAGSKRPNRFSVRDVGVAVNAKYDRFGCLRRIRPRYSSGVSSDRASLSVPIACRSRAAASPP